METRRIGAAGLQRPRTARVWPAAGGWEIGRAATRAADTGCRCGVWSASWISTQTRGGWGRRGRAVPLMVAPYFRVGVRDQTETIRGTKYLIRRSWAPIPSDNA